MNKDVIYVEPEDDITDIILKIENAKEKIVALVPPKKAGVFRSVVNIKLIAKAGVTSDKTVVLVTVDPSILKLAAATKLPVAKDLNSAPTVPTLNPEEAPDEEEEDELVEEEDGTVETEEDAKEAESSKSDKAAKKEAKEAEAEEEEEEEEEEGEAPKKKEKKPKKKKGRLLGWIKLHKILSTCIGVGILALIGLLIWMLFIAPAVDIVVDIKTDKKNFSENVTFTDKIEEEDAKEGKFYLEQKKIEIPQEVEFKATGQKNLGERAHGTLTIISTLYPNDMIQVSAGDIFTYDGLSYSADNTVTLRYDGEDTSVCQNADKNVSPDYTLKRCIIYGKVNVTATQAGTKYNLSSKPNGWSTIARLDEIKLEGSMAGGTDNIITVVQQIDIENAKNELVGAKEEENKNKLYETIDDNYYIIDSSFEQNTSETVATPAADEEVKEGVKPSIKTTTTVSVYVIDKVKLEEFIKNKANLEENQEVYDIRDIYVENIAHVAVGATTKLKAQYFIGPKITESEVVDKIKGKGMGDAQREIRDIYGVSDVHINPSYSWVVMIPNDSNKVSVKFEVKDQDGNEIKTDEETESTDEESEERSDEKSDEESKKDEKE